MRYSELDLKNLNGDERKELILNYRGQRVIIKTRHEPWLQRGKILGDGPDKPFSRSRYLFKSEDVTRGLETGEVITGKKILIHYLDTEKILIECGQVKFNDIGKCLKYR